LVGRFEQLIVELKRRRVFRALLAWGIFSFAVLQIVEPILHGLDLRDWILKAVVVLLGIGFPATALLSWVYDLTSRGVVRTGALAGPPGSFSDPALALEPRESLLESGGGELSLPHSRQARSGQARGALPRSFTPLVGREGEVRAVIDALETSPLVTITGSGGTGKTRVAIAAAEGVARALARRVAYVDLAAVNEPALVPKAAAAAIRLRDLPGDLGLTEAIVGALRDEVLLVVMDNCEHLVEACAAFAASVLAGCRGVRFLATSQLPLGVAGEAVYRLAPLAAPPDIPAPPAAELVAWRARYPALDLLVQRLSTVDPGFELNEAQAPHAAEICRQLDGLPLALELVAPRARVLSLREIAVELGHRFELLSRSDRDRPSRQRGLTAVLEWSYGLLSSVEQRALERLSVFAGTFNHAAAAAVWAPLAEDHGVLVDLLQGLVDKSFVLTERTADDGRRFRLLETVRHYASQRLGASGEGDDARARLLTWALALVEGERRSARIWYEIVATEYDNLSVAFEVSQGTAASATEGLRLAVGLWHFWLCRGYHSGIAMLERALAFAPTAPAPLRAEALVALAVVRSGVPSSSIARPVAQLDTRTTANAGLMIALALRDDRLTALARLSLSLVELSEGKKDMAETLAAEAVECARRSGVRWVLALALQSRSMWASVVGDRALALASMREAASLVDEESPALLYFYISINLGLQAYSNAQHQEARQTWRFTLAEACHFSIRRGVAGCMEGAAYLETERRAFFGAAHLLGAAERIRDLTRTPLLPHWTGHHSAAEAQIRAALGGSFERERQAGANLSYEEAMARCLSALS